VEEGIAVYIVKKNVPFLDPSCINMMDGTREVDSRSSWHARQDSKYGPSETKTTGMDDMDEGEKTDLFFYWRIQRFNCGCRCPKTVPLLGDF
jgi:hypothetical protein